MARAGRPKQPDPPAALPPEQRTVGQLVGEALRAYGRRFWSTLALGIPVALVNALAWTLSREAQLVASPLAALLVTLSYVVACTLVLGAPLRRRSTVVAYVTGVLVFIPFPFLAAIYVLPGLAWLALVGLAVPAALVEGIGIRAALVRGYRLARADYVHVLGGIATLALVVFLTQAVLFFTLREYAQNTRVAAAVLASLVVSPLLFVGAALLYVDQEARLRSDRDDRKERDADLPHADDAHGEGRPDAAREPRSTA